MPVYNEATHLPRVLESISEQEFDLGGVFFVAVDGNSSDGSAEIIRSWLSSSQIDGCVIANPKRRIPVALNLALAYATTDDVVIRLDAHTIYGPHYLGELLAALEKAPDDVGCVGSGHVPIPGETFEQRVVEALYTNPIGLGGADFRTGNDVRDVDSVYLGAWRPGLVERCGGFNETMEANEDGDLAARIRRLGYRVVRVPLPCRFLIKRGVLGSIRQWNRYGFWRAKMLQRNPQFIRMRHVLSPLVALGAVLLLLSPWRMLLAVALIPYGILLFRCRAKGEPVSVTLATLLFFPAVQFAFALGMLSGVVTGPGNNWSKASAAPVPEISS